MMWKSRIYRPISRGVETKSRIRIQEPQARLIVVGKALTKGRFDTGGDTALGKPETHETSTEPRNLEMLHISKIGRLGYLASAKHARGVWRIRVEILR